jgi:methylated-DNA-[protein]-cysteine S-methyltransferase
MSSLHAVTVPSPIGDFTIVCSPAGVVATVFDDETPGDEVARIERTLEGRMHGEAAEYPAATARTLATTARREARAYFTHRGRTFTVPADLSLVGSGFSRRVLGTVATIPYGELWTYGDVAGMASSPRAARAAGSALASCPIELFVPCHRVVHAGGTIGGYGRHEDRKRWLLRHEGAIS